MKNLFVLFAVFMLPISVFAETVMKSGIMGISALTCPEGQSYSICGGDNARLHNSFVSAMVQKNTQKAITLWDKMLHSISGTHGDIDRGDYIANTLFGDFAPEGTSVIPDHILLKKSYKGGILALGMTNFPDPTISDYQISFMRYKKTAVGDMLYVYSIILAPVGTSQYASYARLYNMSRDDSSHIGELGTDLEIDFRKGVFKNKDTNSVYQKFLKSIK